MTQEMYFEKIKEFLETKPASQKLISYLNTSAEIGILIGNNLECSYFKQDSKPKLEKRAPKSPDVIFHFSPEAAETLLKTEASDLGDLVVDVVKLYLAGAVKIQLPGAIPLLLFRGYVQILKASHAQLLGLLKDRGLDNLKILGLIQKLKSQK